MQPAPRLTASLALLVLSVPSLHARPQNPPQPPASGIPAPVSGPQRGSEQGRGRGRIVPMILSAPWPDGAQIPIAHSQAGGDLSPALTWTNAPENAASFVLIVHDLDAPTGSGTDDALHWLVWNIPGAARSLSERIPQGATLADGAHQISVTGPNYRGPAAPPSGPAHHYVFELYALDVMLEVPAVGASPAQTRAAVIAGMAGHVRGKGVYTGMFKRQ